MVSSTWPLSPPTSPFVNPSLSYTSKRLTFRTPWLPQGSKVWQIKKPLNLQWAPPNRERIPPRRRKAEEMLKTGGGKITNNRDANHVQPDHFLTLLLWKKNSSETTFATLTQIIMGGLSSQKPMIFMQYWGTRSDCYFSPTYSAHNFLRFSHRRMCRPKCSFWRASVQMKVAKNFTEWTWFAPPF